MPIVNGVKFSKSELILRLLNKDTRDTTLKAVLNSTGVRLPKYILFGKNYDPENCKNIILNNKYTGYYSYFSLKSKLKPLNLQNFEVSINSLINETNTRLFKILKVSSSNIPVPSSSHLETNEDGFTSIPEGLVFEEDHKIIFYLSMLILQSQSKMHKLRLEQKALCVLKKVFKKEDTAGTKKLLKFCKFNFQKETIVGFIQSSVCEMKFCNHFLFWISCKLPQNFLDLWFEDNFDLSYDIVRKLNYISLSESVPFKENIVESLLPYKNFKRYVFNNEINRQFLDGMFVFTNRPDYNFYYDFLFDKKFRPCDVKSPKDECEYEFFNSFRNGECLSSNLIKIRNYLRKHNYTKIFNLFVSQNVELFIEYASLANLEDIFIRIIQYNNNLELTRGPDNINKIIFNGLKNNEKLFRKIVKYFKDPADPTLYNILTGNLKVEIGDAIDYIKMGYDIELCNYFASQEVVDCIRVMDSWNYDFFLDVFASYDKFTIFEALAILEYLNSHDYLFKNKKTLSSVGKIIDTIIELKSTQIFFELPKNLKIFYLMKHEDSIRLYIESIDPNEISMEEAAGIYELKCLSPNAFKEVKSKSDVNLHWMHATADIFPLNCCEMIDFVFECIFVRKNEANFIFVGLFKQILCEISSKFTKEDFIKLFDSSPVVKLDYSFFISNAECKSKKIVDFLEAPEASCFSTQLEKVYYILKIGFGSKYSLFALFDQILGILASNNSLSKILALYFVDPSLLCKRHILKFMNAVVPLLSSSNYMICKLSKDSLNMVHLETKEIQNILPEIIQAFSSSKPIVQTVNNDSLSSYSVFLESFKSTVFNNYLCFNSLNLILQLLFKYLSEYTKDSLFILSKISAIIKDKDLKYVSGLIFSNLSKFVVNNNFCSREALDVSTEFSLYVNFEDFDILLKNLNSMRICTYLVGILKFKGNHELNKRIISHVISASSHENVEPAFIAAASELEEFNQYLEQFLPAIKCLFKNSKPEIRNIAVKAFKFILERAHSNVNRASSSKQDELSSTNNTDGTAEDKEFSKIRNFRIINEISEFLIHSIIYDDFTFRIAALEIIKDHKDSLPIIYILRNDHHSLVKKEAQDIWKTRVPNTNTLLRGIYKDVLEYVKYCDCKTFSYALHGAVSEMAVKYSSFLEKYISDELVSISNAVIDEFILLEAVKAGKMIGIAIEFIESHFIINIFREIYKTAVVGRSSDENNQLSAEACKGNTKQNKVYSSLSFYGKYIKISSTESISCETFLKYFTTDQLMKVCIADQDISQDIYVCYSDTPESTLFIDFLSISQKIEILKCFSGTSHLKPSEDISYLLRTIESCTEIENALLKLHPIFSYNYLLNPKIIDHHSLGRIFERVFDSCTDVEVFITPKNSRFLKNCNFYNIHKDFHLVLFLYLMSRSDDKKSFEKVISLMHYIMEKDVSLVSCNPNDLPILPNDFIFEISGYLLRNYISLNRRNDCHRVILQFYEKYGMDIGFFKNIIEDSVLNK